MKNVKDSKVIDSQNMKQPANKVKNLRESEQTLSAFKYSYAPDYGKNPNTQKEIDTQHQKGKIHSQEQIDKQVDKGLAQVYREQSLSFPKLLGKIQQEMKTDLQNSLKNQERDPRANRLIQAQQYGYPEAENTRNTRLILNQVLYSDLHTRQVHNSLSWTLKASSYVEQCTEKGASTNCTDFKLNGSYRQCKHEIKPLVSVTSRTFPFNQYWVIALGLLPNTRP